MNKYFMKSFLAIAFPIMMQAIATTAVGLVDNIMVGQLGGTVIGAVVTSNRFLMMFNFTLWGITGATSIFIAQYFGAKKVEELKQSFRFSLLFSYMLFIPLIIGILFFRFEIASFFIDDLNVISEMEKYLLIMLLGYIPFIASSNYSGALRAIKQIKIPMIATITSVIVNSLLNYILIFGNFGFPRLEIQGAAIATVIARFVEFIIMYSVTNYYNFDFATKLKDIFKLSKEKSKQIFLKALPLMINEFAYGAGLSMLLKLYATRGTIALAAYGIAGTSTDLFYSAVQGIMAAVTVLVGHKLGENNLSKAKENGYNSVKMIGCIGITFSVLLIVISPLFPIIYNLSNTFDEYTIALSHKMIIIIGCALWAQYIAIGNYMLLRVGGDIKSTLLLDGIYMWFVNISLVTILAYGTNFNVLVIMIFGHITDIIKMGISFYFVKKEKWINNLTQ